MSEKKDSSSAIALFEKLKSSGHLIDVYDFDRVNSDKSDDAPFSISDTEGFDEHFGLSYRNHLFAIFVDTFTICIRAQESPVAALIRQSVVSSQT
jgi:hypothetical protein